MVFLEVSLAEKEAIKDKLMKKKGPTLSVSTKSLMVKKAIIIRREEANARIRFLSGCPFNWLTKS
jgi:hypothetical protein